MKINENQLKINKINENQLEPMVMILEGIFCYYINPNFSAKNRVFHFIGNNISRVFLCDRYIKLDLNIIILGDKSNQY